MWAYTVPPLPPPSLASRRFSLWNKHTSTPRLLVPHTSVSTDLTIHPSLRTACDTALHHLPKVYAQALHSRISTLEQCNPDPSIQNEDPAHIPALLTPDSPLDAPYSSNRTPSSPPPPKCTSPSSLDACAAPPFSSLRPGHPCRVLQHGKEPEHARVNCAFPKRGI